MKNTLSLFISILLLSASGMVTGQTIPRVSTAKYFDKTPPLREMRMVVPGTRDRSWKDHVIRNEMDERKPLEGIMPLPQEGDPLRQSWFGQRSLREPIANFEGTGNRNSVYPPDTDGDIGPDHYFQMINLSFQIFDRQGNSLYGPADNSTLWQDFIGPWTGTNDGDPILLYDEMADRWVATQFAIDTPDDTYWELVAISATGDPLGEWYRYAFQFPVFNDYPKFGIWPDGYYSTYNMFGSYRRVAAAAFERDAMLAGDPDAMMILFDLPEDSEPWSMLPADFDGPPPPEGAPNWFIYGRDDAFNSGPDALEIWAFSADWDNPGNSVFEYISTLPVEPFDSRLCDAPRNRCIDQPDGAPRLESLSDRLMYRLQYRNFGDYQVMVTNHTVDVDGYGHAGIRWYELRNDNDGQGWYIYQQGTYAPDNDHRWMGSIAMNGNGDIALGFSVSSLTRYPTIRYTGRTAESPLGYMTFFEETVIDGGGVQTGDASRWGDYSKMSVDPVDDSTFWYTTEYVEQTGSVRWQTRVTGFQLIEDLVAPAPVNDLSAEPTTTNAIRLTWTATGNDTTTGTAFLYDIRHSPEPITPENFENAIPVENTPSPQTAGTQEVFIVDELEYSTTYHFAMRVRDKQFNFSPVSNSDDAVTIGPPHLVIEEAEINQKIFPGSSGSRNWTLENRGEGDIYLKMVKDTIMTTRGDPGDVLGSYANVAYAISGMTFVDSILYMTDLESSELYKYDTSAQVVTDTFAIHEEPFGIVWDGEYLWIGTKTGEVKAYDTEGTATGASFPLPYDGFSALAWDGEYFLANFILAGNPVIYKLDHQGNIMGRIYTDIDNMTIWQSVWVYEHTAGHYWFTNNTGKIVQLRFEGDQATVVQQFAAPFSISYALTHNQYDLLYGRIGGTIDIIEDGIYEVNWLKLDPIIDTLRGGDAHDITLGFETGRLMNEDQYAYIEVISNDVDNPNYQVPVQLNFSDIDLGPDSSFCGDIVLTLDPGQGFASYLWSDGSNGSTLEADSNIYGTGVQDFWVDVTDIGGQTHRDSITLVFNDCAGVMDFGEGKSAELYPNPTDGILFVRLNGMDENVSITVNDMAGRLVRKKTIRNNGSIHVIPIDLAGQSKGIYVIKVELNEMVRTGTVVYR